MTRDLVVFLDDGGVMNDNAQRSGQWQRFVAEYFAPRLGGDPLAWSQANRVVATSLFDPAGWEARFRAPGDYASFDRAYQLDWLGGMCRLVGVACPADDEAVSLAHAASLYVCRRVRSAIPGAVEAIHALHARGYRLNTASGESSRELTGYLESMGVRDSFDRLYGPDLIATLKSGPAYYELLLADAGVVPENALVVDDSPRAIAWAASVGARTVLVGSGPCPDANLVIRCLAGLPEVLANAERTLRSL